LNSSEFGSVFFALRIKRTLEVVPYTFILIGILAYILEALQVLQDRHILSDVGISRADTFFPRMKFIDTRTAGQNADQVAMLKRPKVVFPETRDVVDRLVSTPGTGQQARLFFLFLHDPRERHTIGSRLGLALGREGVIGIDAGALRLLQRAQVALTKSMEDHRWPISCSIGAVVFDKAPENIDALIGVADGLMYQVKQAGKNAIRIEQFSFGGILDVTDTSTT
jgi:hypothetical protein